MGLYIKDKKKFLELCEDFYDNGNDFFVIGHDKHGNLRGEVNTNASEVSLGRLLFDARQNKLFGCGLTHCEELQRDKVAEEWGKFNGVIIPESSLINWEQRHYEIARTCLPYWLGWIERNYDDLFSENEDVDTDTEACCFAIGTAEKLIKMLKGEKDE